LFLLVMVMGGLLLTQNLDADSLFKKNPSPQSVQGQGTTEPIAEPTITPLETQNTAQIVKFSRNVQPNFLQGKADTDLVELSPNRLIKVGEVRRLTTLAKKIQASKPGSHTPQVLKLKPAAQGKLLKNASDLSEALKLPDSDTVQLPSGRTLTVGMLKLVREDVESKLGKSLTSLTLRPNLNGAALKVTAKSDWKDILQRPDTTILESTSGTRITVGELKQALAASGKSPSTIPARQ
jgi:hypothetical protein